jgi:AAA domain-containing protein/bifunctional DNA primase/polymerase-like protein
MATQTFDRTNAVTSPVSVEERLRRAKAATPVVAGPAHTEIDLSTVTFEELSLDPDNFDDPLVKAIYRAREPKVQAAPTKSPFRMIAEASIARGETRILPIVVGGKNPAKTWKGTAIDVLSLDDWLQVLPSYINEVDAQFPDCNGCVIAKPEEKLFIDNDTTAEFRAGYEAFSGESYPTTFTSSATENHSQEHFLQTDLTRAMGNVKQFSVDGISISVRQRNLYVLAEGSKHPKGGTYNVVVQADIVPMPDKMVAYIQYLYQKSIDGKSTIKPGQTVTATQVTENKPPINCEVDGPPIPFGEHDNTLFDIACSLRARTSGDGGWDYDEIYERLVEVCQARCENYGADYLEMCKAKAKQGMKYNKGIPSSKTVLMPSYDNAKAAPAVEAIPMKPLVTEQTLGAAQMQIAEANEKLLGNLTPLQRKIFDDIHASRPDLTYDTVIEQAIKIEGLGKLAQETSSTNWRDEFRNIAQMEQGDIVMIIDGVLQEGVCFIGATAGDGKTLIALAMSKAITLGQPLFGISEFLVKIPRNVIYLIPESADKPFRVRCNAFRLPEDDRFLARTISSGLPLSLDNPSLLEAVRQTKAVVFLDTVSRFVTSEDENSAAQNRVLVDNIIALRAAGSPCVVVLHHAKKSSKAKGEAMTLENALRGTGDYAAMCDTVYGIRADERLRDNGAGPLEMDIVNLKDREQVGGLNKLRLAASYKKEGSIFPVSYINETGNLRVVNYKQTMDRLEATLIQMVQDEPTISSTEIAEQAGINRRKVVSILEGRGWHSVKGGSGGHSPWHEDKGLPCPHAAAKKAAKAKKGKLAGISNNGPETEPGNEPEDIPY